MSTAAQVAANRANAQLSSGPTSIEGKAKSSLNAVKTGLTGRTVLLPGDDASAYEVHVASFVTRYHPATDEERTLVQSLADTEWRLFRIPSLEMGIYALGRLEFAELFPHEDPAVRNHLIEAKIFIAYQRQLNNLSVQESRLRRQREKDSAALQKLQDDRKRDESKRVTEASKRCIRTVEDRNLDAEAKSENFGFVFPSEDGAVNSAPGPIADWSAEKAA